MSAGDPLPEKCTVALSPTSTSRNLWSRYREQVKLNEARKRHYSKFLISTIYAMFVTFVKRGYYHLMAKTSTDQHTPRRVHAKMKTLWTTGVFQRRRRRKEGNNYRHRPGGLNLTRTYKVLKLDLSSKLNLVFFF